MIRPPPRSPLFPSTTLFRSQSDLKRHDAGQFAATIVADVPADAAGPMLDRLKQIGKMARLDVQRKQTRSEEHTSELQSQSNLVCRLLLEKKKKNKPT